MGPGPPFVLPLPERGERDRVAEEEKDGNNVGRLCVAADNEDRLNENLYRPGWGFIEVQRPLITSLQPQSKQMEPALGIFQVSL